MKTEEISFRLPLTIAERQTLDFVLERLLRSDFLKSKNEKKHITSVLEKLPDLKYLHLENKRTATKKANEAKTNTSIKKIENAINLLRLEGRKPTINSIAKTANMSYNTVKKYQYLFDNEK